MYTFIYVFVNAVLSETGTDLMEHFNTALAFGEDGLIGSVIIPEGNDVPTDEEAIARCLENNAMCAEFSREYLA